MGQETPPLGLAHKTPSDYKELKDVSAPWTSCPPGRAPKRTGKETFSSMSHTDSPTPDGALAGRRQAFFRGVGDGFKMPVYVVAASMLGFGSLARDSGISFAVTVVSTATVWGLPGQVAFVELFAVGAPVLVMVVASSMANMRFLPMSISMIPLFRGDKAAWGWRYVMVAMMSVNTWALTIRHSPEMPDHHRAPYFTGLSILCMTTGVLATALGYHLAGTLPVYITVSLIFLNFMYFTFLFCGVRQRNCLLAVIIGAILGPLFHLISPDWGLPFCGVIAGSAAVLVDKRMGDGDG